MTCARLLAPEHDVHLFESGNELGGHTATKDIQTASGNYAIDTGFIVFNDWTYPNFIRLLTEAGVKWKDSEMSFAVKNERNGVEYNGKDLAHLFAQRRNLFRPSFYRMIFEILRFNRNAPQILKLKNEDHDSTVGAYLDKNGYSEFFAENYALAMGSAIWSASVEQMREFPLRFFVQFFKNHGMLSVDERPVWRVIEGGSRSYIAPLLRGVKNIHLASPIRSVSRGPTDVSLEISGSHSRKELFDQVIFACHSDTVRKILTDATATERDIFAALNYQSNDVILHTDTSVLPKTKKTWAAWNHLITADDTEKVALTYHMNILQGISAPENFLVSLNLAERIDPEKILGRWTYDHPEITLASVASQQRWSEISHLESRTHFCGAYWLNGFHEDGVNSALRVAKTFGSGWLA